MTHPMSHCFKVCLGNGGARTLLKKGIGSITIHEMIRKNNRKLGSFKVLKVQSQLKDSRSASYFVKEKG